MEGKLKSLDIELCLACLLVYLWLLLVIVLSGVDFSDGTILAKLTRFHGFRRYQLNSITLSIHQ